MRLLAVDTTTGSGSAALIEDGRVRAEIGVDSFGTHSSRLPSSIDVLLKSLRWTAAELDGFAVTPGPGSFTGIRIGLGMIQALAFASGKPIVPVSSLRAMAWKLRNDGVPLVCPAHDAKKGEVYAALYSFEGPKMKSVVAEGAYAPARFVALLPKGRKILFIGGGYPLIFAALTAAGKARAILSPRTPFIAAEVGLLGVEALAAGEGVGPDALEPLYLRRSQAEEGR
ncbi:MAG: tRNA (adenosine(37)-N6)-threonylcarbamoyltransferase complex dimerization subunit type 1 TsaB [Candidatus Aminicenantes bacterium]|nr:tRNA (adenosine(37)-N6)-threonylcarbamoyltransferase complex dimerization subunit type 1 TsaB [Candidatus Aminicenantes bacterium]